MDEPLYTQKINMTDVGTKEKTHRTATAAGRVFLNDDTYHQLVSGCLKKGDVLTVAKIAGIMAAKKTPELLPLCHPIGVTGIEMTITPEHEALQIHITATVRCTGRTGAEMEALTAVSVAALTIYDMCKAVQKDIVIGEIRLVSKSGGKSGEYRRQGD
ncbi:cyclic pyranopterin monophosphate synthase MoaC [Oscillospiraceae bacterium WX1]